jgi:hypothetical protein
MVEALKWHLFHEHQPRYFRCDPPRLDVGPFVPGLVAALKDPDPKHRLAAAERLSDHADKVPAAARDAIFDLPRDPAVQKMARRERRPVRRAPLRAVRRARAPRPRRPPRRRFGPGAAVRPVATALARVVGRRAPEGAKADRPPRHRAGAPRRRHRGPPEPRPEGRGRTRAPAVVRSDDPEVRADAARGLRYLGRSARRT